jgi:hypothetical protein
MKRILFLLKIIVLSISSAYSQLSVIPSFGIELSNTRISKNGGGFSNPLPALVKKQISIRADYQFRNSGSGVFGGVSSNNSVLEVNTGNATTPAATQYRIEFGYQHTTKLGFTPKTNQDKKKSDPKTTTIRFQDQFGFAYVPSVKKDIKTTGKNGEDIYSYYAGNWNLAFIASWGIEISKGNKKFLNIGVQYLKGLTNLGDRTFTVTSENQTVETKYSSRASSWSLNVGFPFKFFKNHKG